MSPSLLKQANRPLILNLKEPLDHKITFVSLLFSSIFQTAFPLSFLSHHSPSPTTLSTLQNSKTLKHTRTQTLSLSLSPSNSAMTAVPPPAPGRELSSPPSDGISNLRFSNHSDHLLVSSWDKTVRLYDASANVLRGEFKHGGPVLDCCFHDDSSGFSAGADNTVRRLVFSSSKEDILGRHDAPVRCVEYSYAAGQLITGSWDKTLKCWDPRGASGQERTLVGTYPQPERVYSLSLVGNRLVVATAGRHVNVYDLRNMSQPEQRRESSLKYQTRCVRCYPNGTGYALSSVEGRVAMEFFDLSEASQTKKYAFKCHRKSEAGRDIVYPVNAIAFHPIYGTFATGGCDGYVNVWDGNNKKRLYQYSKYPTSIAALSFSRDGRLLAVASSYTFEEGDKPHEPDSIFVRSVNEIEVKPKPKVYPNPPA
ncbi:mitotic checkpoint protein BUB3.2 isoform X1 [Prunus dulcis]|nr:mitotic checkpoint protein BUB3.2 isoform X1 [Prunus dulcis]